MGNAAGFLSAVSLGAPDALGERLIETAVIVAVGLVLAVAGSRLAARRTAESYRRYYARKATRYVVAVASLIALGIVWRPFARQLGLLLGLLAAGVALALQEVIGAVAGWFNILSGGIFRVGDRVQLGGVNGDVIDITPLRTKLMEIGSEASAKGTGYVAASTPAGSSRCQTGRV